MKKNFTARLKSAGAGAPARCALMICTLIFVSTAFGRPPSGGSAASLDGKWYHDGKPTRILVAFDNRSITIINEFGQRSDGYANGPRNLVIPSLGKSGQVNNNGRRISWTNGTEWMREAKNPGPDSGVSLSGRWFRNGQPTSIELAPDGRNFTIVQEWGLRATGRITGNGELIVPAWKVTGRVRQNGQRIKWSNGTEWNTAPAVLVHPATFLPQIISA
jgi:hypothetical protein